MILDDIFLIQIVVTIIFCLIFCIFDVCKGYVPDRLNYLLVVFGIISNLVLSLLTTNIKFIVFSIISYCITFLISVLLWQLNVWGGGDVKLFASISAVIPFGISSKYFNISPLFSFYPFSFTVIVNSILISFPLLLGLLIYLCVKNDTFNKNKEVAIGLLNYKSLKMLIDSNFNKHIKVCELKEGMMINNFYFDNEKIRNLIENSKNTNLEVFKSDDKKSKYYFKTTTAGGITKKDMYLLKIMNAQEIISSQISIKLGFPFVPAIFLGLLVAIFYGDLSMLILKNLVFVI